MKIPNFSSLTFPQNQRIHMNSTFQKHNTTKNSLLKFFSSVLSQSSTTKNSLLGSHIHCHIIKLGFSNDTFSMNNVLSMYSKCHLLSHALNLFDQMSGRRNSVTWTSMISGSVQNNEHKLGLELYVEMMRFGYCLNEFALASVLSACVALEEFRFGCSVHLTALKVGLDRNSYVGSLILRLYATCGNVEAAEIAFECIGYRDLVCWNAMVECYALNGYGYDAMISVVFMRRIGFVLDQFTYLSALKGCLSTRSLNFGRQIHSLVIHSWFAHGNAVMNSIMDLYFKMDMKDYAMMIFTRMQVKDQVSWNTLIGGFAQEEDEREVVDLFTIMLSSGLKPNHVTFSALFRLCGVTENLRVGFQFYALCYHLGYFDHVLVVNSLINMFSKCGMVESAYSLFCSLYTRNIVTWNEMISGYNLNGFMAEALQLFSNSIKVGIKSDEFRYRSVLGACQGAENLKAAEQIHSNIIKSGFGSCCYVYCSLVASYVRVGKISSSFKIFQDVKKPLDLVTWGTMISTLSKRGMMNEALSLLNCLREDGENPDEFILGSSLNSCANDVALNQLRGIHSHVIKSGYENHSCVTSAVIDAYAKCGDITGAKKAFDTISKDDDAIVFNTMIMAYAHHGLITEAIQLFDRMRRTNLNPTQATFVAIISACAHLGLVEQGKFFFDQINAVYGMHPSRDNFACLVDLFARNGLLKKARDVMDSMPYEPWPAIWRCLLNGCRIYGDREIGKEAADKILKLVPNSDGGYVLLSNVYAEDGKWKDAERLRARMQEKGVQKVVGYSIIET